MTKWVYTFGDGAAEGSAGDRTCSAARAPTLPKCAASACRCRPASPSPPRSATGYYANGKRLSGRAEGAGRRRRSTISPALPAGASAIPEKLLLVSVRSGARASMPGMMDTVLNLGLNDVTVEALAADSGDARFAYDSYRRFIQMYSDVVLGPRPRGFRRNPGGREGPARPRTRHRILGRRTGGRSSRSTRRRSRRNSASRSRRIRRSSSGARSARSSRAG